MQTATDSRVSFGEASAPDIAEIEVTPEMIRAGLDAYLALDSDEDGVERLLTEVYQAMALAAQAAESRSFLRSESFMAKALEQVFRENDLKDLEAAEFRRLLRFAHAEGRLPAILKALDRVAPSQA